jgi:hypothetical protein
VEPPCSDGFHKSPHSIRKTPHSAASSLNHSYSVNRLESYSSKAAAVPSAPQAIRRIRRATEEHSFAVPAIHYS